MRHFFSIRAKDEWLPQIRFRIFRKKTAGWPVEVESMKKVVYGVLAYLAGTVVFIAIACFQASGYYRDVYELVDQGNEVITDTVRTINKTMKHENDYSTNSGSSEKFNAYHIWIGSGTDTVDVRWTHGLFCSEGDEITAVSDGGEYAVWYWIPESRTEAMKCYMGGWKIYTGIAGIIALGCIIAGIANKK